MSRYRMFYKQSGAWKAQNTRGFHYKDSDTWKLVEAVYEKQSGAWVRIYDALFESDFESDLADGESLSISSIGTLRITATGKAGKGGDGGKGAEHSDRAEKRESFFRKPKRWGGAGGGGGGGGRSTGATAVSDVEVEPGDTILREDSATHVVIKKNGTVVVSAENGRDGTNGADGSKGSPGKGSGGGKGGTGGPPGRASESIGNVSRTDGATGEDGKDGKNGQTPAWPWAFVVFGEPGTGGQGFPNNGRTGEQLRWAFRTDSTDGSGGAGGKGQVVTGISSCRIEVLP